MLRLVNGRKPVEVEGRRTILSDILPSRDETIRPEDVPQAHIVIKAAVDRNQPKELNGR